MSGFRTRLRVKIAVRIAPRLLDVYDYGSVYQLLHGKEQFLPRRSSICELASGKAASNFAAEMNLVISTARDLSSTLRILKPSLRRTGERTRSYALVKLVQSPLTLWTLWEPGLFDGLDAKYAGQSGQDPSGRFNLRWTMDPRNSVDTNSNLAQFRTPAPTRS